MSILRIELRRSIAPWAGFALVVVALGFLFLFPGPWWKEPVPWNSQWTPAAMWLRFLLVFLWPIAIGAGTIQGMRDSRSGMVELLATSSRPGWHRAAKLAAALGILLMLGLLAVFAVGVVQLIANGAFFSFAWLPLVLVALMSVVAAGWLGLGVGRLLPHPLTAPVIAVLALIAMIVSWGSMSVGTSLVGMVPNRLALLGPGLPEPRGTFLTAATSVDIGQGLWFLGVAGAGFLLLTAESVRSRLLALMPVVVAGAVVMPIFPSVPEDNTVIDRAAAALVCDGPICVAKAHEGRLGQVAGPGVEALRLLAKLPGAPTRVEESIPPSSPVDGSRRPAADVVLVDFQGNYAARNAQGENLRSLLLAGAGTPSCYGFYRGSLPEAAARTVSAAWFTGELKPLPDYNWITAEVGPIADRAWQAFRQLPAPEQQARILTMRQRLLTCQGDPLDALVPGMKP